MKSRTMLVTQVSMPPRKPEPQLTESPLFSSIHPGDAMTAPCRVVLHQSHKDGEWVTHLQNMQDKGFNWGHYHDHYPDALVEYIARCKKEGVTP